MDNHFLMSALSVGFGVGVGISLASGQSMSRLANPFASSGVTGEMIERELRRLVADGTDMKINFKDFPYYLSEETRLQLISAAFVHLKQADFSKHTRNLSPASRTILLSGPAERYQRMLAMALAHYYQAKLLLLDAPDFSLKIQSKYGIHTSVSSFKRSISETALEKMSSILGSFSILPPREETKANQGTLKRRGSGVDLTPSGFKCVENVSSLQRSASAASDINTMSEKCVRINPVSIKRTSSWTFDEKLLVDSLYRVLVSISASNPIILYLRNVDKLLLRSQRMHTLIQKMFQKISGPILILGSRMVDPANGCKEDERLTLLFPHNIDVKPPVDETDVRWKALLEEDIKNIQFQDSRNIIEEALLANDLCCDLDCMTYEDTLLLGNHIEEILMSVVPHHLMKNKDPEYRNGKLFISMKSLCHVLRIFQESKLGVGRSANMESDHDGVKGRDESDSGGSTRDSKSNGGKSAVDVPPDDEFEKRIRLLVIPANEIEVTFEDVGALDEVKESLQELVMLPLRRPDLFIGGLLKPCKGILLYGPPGTGKTMMAKAIAKEAGASFINISMSTITSKWFGEDEKMVKALFTLAAKVSPTIIFVDEVDSMLGQRSRCGEHEVMRRIKNEFMIHWDGLMTKSCERILVLAATNRPFDLDEAIIRRFQRRIMVDLPSLEAREKILTTLLSKEKIEDGLDYKELAAVTEGYTGSDLKNLCMTAAYRPVRELIQKEKQKDSEKKEKDVKAKKSVQDSESKEVEEKEIKIILRPLNMDDLKQAKNEVAASFAAESLMMEELNQWKALYGEGGSRKNKQLTYFL